MGRPVVRSPSGSPALPSRIAMIGGVVTFVGLFAAILLPNLTSVRVWLAFDGPAVAPAPPPPPAPGLLLSANSVPQGGALSVRLRSAALAAASVNFRNRDYPMVERGDQWFAIIGAGQSIGSEQMVPVGDYPAVVSYQFVGGADVFSTRVTITVTPTNFPVDVIEPGAVDAGLLTPELAVSEAAQLQQAYSAFTPQQFWQGAFAMPVNGAVTTDFGARRSYEGGPATGSHSGVDLGVPSGTPVGASAAGRVAWTGTLPDRGNGVIVDHGLGVFTGYFHLSRITAQPEQMVGTGDVIGLAGSTGLSTGPHVHWEVVVAGVDIDAMQFAQLTLP